MFDQMFKGLTLNPGTNASLGQGVVNGTTVTGSAALRGNTNYRGNIAQGNYSAIANGGSTSLNQTNLATGVAGGLLRNGGLPENFIVNNPQLKYPICVYRLGDGNYSALLMKCTHQGAELQVTAAFQAQ